MKRIFILDAPLCAIGMCAEAQGWMGTLMKKAATLPTKVAPKTAE